MTFPFNGRLVQPVHVKAPIYTLLAVVSKETATVVVGAATVLRVVVVG